MPEEVPALTGRTRQSSAVGVALVVAAGLVLRFWTRSGLWLDEALTVDIARLPLHAHPRRAQARRGATALLLPAALLDQPLRPVQRRRPLPLGRHRRPDPPRGLALREALRRAGRGLDDAGAAGQRALRRLLRHRVAHVRAGHPADRPRVPGPAAGGRGAAAGQPDRRGRRDGRAALHPVLVALPRRRWSGSGCSSSIVRDPPPRARPEAAPWAALIALGVGRPALRALGADVPLPVPAHRRRPWAAPPNFSAVINAVTGFTDNQGSTLSRPATNQGRLLAVIYFAMLALAVFGVGQSRPHHRARPAHPARARAASASSCSARSSPPSPAASSPRSAFSSRYAAVVFLPLLLLVASAPPRCSTPRRG